MSSHPPSSRRERCDEHHIPPGEDQSVAALLPSDETFFRLAEIFQALGDTTRAKIVYALLHEQLCTCELAELVHVSESAVSQHLRVLRNLRIVRGRREGRKVYYTLADQHVRLLINVVLSHLRDGTPVADVAPAGRGS